MVFLDSNLSLPSFPVIGIVAGLALFGATAVYAQTTVLPGTSTVCSLSTTA